MASSSSNDLNKGEHVGKGKTAVGHRLNNSAANIPILNLYHPDSQSHPLVCVTSQRQERTSFNMATWACSNNAVCDCEVSS